MQRDLASQLSAFARRGQWKRCLDIAQQLATSHHHAGLQALLQHPDVLHSIAQHAYAHSSQSRWQSVSAVLLLCGQAVRSVSKVPLCDSAAAAAGPESSGRSEHAGAQQNTAVSIANALDTSGNGSCSRPQNASVKSNAAVHATSSPSSPSSLPQFTFESVAARLTPAQRQEWTRLVSMLLHSFITRWQVRDGGGTASSITASPTAYAATSDATLFTAAMDLYAWAEAGNLGLDATLLDKVRAIASKGHETAFSVTGEGDPSFSNTAPMRLQGRLRCSDDVLPKRKEDTPAGGEGLRTRQAASSRIPHRLAAAWRNATSTASLTTAHIKVAPRTFRSEADIRLGFQRAVSRLASPADARAAADYVVALLRTLVQRQWEDTDGERGAPPPAVQLVFLLCVMCEEVLRALDELEASSAFTDGDAAHTQDISAAALESAIVVSAVELSVLQWTCTAAERGSLATLKRNTSTVAGEQTLLGHTAEGKMHVTRAGRHLCHAVMQLCGIFKTSATTSTGTHPATTAPRLSVMLPTTWESEWLATALSDVQHSPRGVSCTSHPSALLLLLRLLVSATHATRGDEADVVAAENTLLPGVVEAAVQLIEIAFQQAEHDGGKVLTLKGIRTALQLPSPNAPNQSSSEVLGSRQEQRTSGSSSRACPHLVAFSEVCADSLNSHIAAFVGQVLDKCTAEVSHALLTGSQQSCSSVHVTRTLTPLALQYLRVTVRALASGFTRSCTTQRAMHEQKKTAKATHALVQLSSGQLCLSRLFTDVEVDTIVAFMRCLLDFSFASEFTDERDRRKSLQMPRNNCAVLHNVLASIWSAETRAVAAEEALRVICHALKTASEDRQIPFQALPQMLHEYVPAMGVAMDSLLANPTVNPHIPATRMQHCLQTLTAVLATIRLGTEEGYAAHYAVLSHVRQWFLTSASSYLCHHVRLFLSTSTTNNSGGALGSEKHVTGRAALASSSSLVRHHAPPLQPLPSAAEQCGAWFHEQFVHLSTHTSEAREDSQRPPAVKGVSRRTSQQRRELRQLCWESYIAIHRLCNVTNYEMTTLAALAGPESSTSQRRDIDKSVDDCCAAVCHSVYNVVSVAQLCHLAIASSSSTVPTSSTPPHVCALLHRSSAPSWNDRPLLTLRTADPAASQEGSLNVLQQHHGKPLSLTQHEALVEAMRHFSHRRRIREAVALFYSYERQNQRLVLAEVELFAEIAKRATTAFLVRLLKYVPPPCESATLASAIVTGAWKGYQRVLRGTAKSARASHENSKRSSSSSSFDFSSSPSSRLMPNEQFFGQKYQRNRQWAVEEAWYEALAVARQAMELLPASAPEEALEQIKHHALLTTLYRLVQARPAWLAPAATAHTELSTEVLVSSVFVIPRSLRWRLWHCGEWTRRSVSELEQTLAFCKAHKDAETAVRGYLRFVRTHVPPRPQSTQRPSSSSSFSVGNHLKGVAVICVPLLSLDTYESLLRMSGSHVTASSSVSPGRWAATFARAAAAASETVKSLQDTIKDLPLPPPQPKDVTAEAASNTAMERRQHDRVEEEEDADMKELYKLRAAMSDPVSSEGAQPAVVQKGSENSTPTDGAAALPTAAGEAPPASAATKSSSSSSAELVAERRLHVNEVNYASLFHTVVASSAPTSLHDRVQRHMSLSPLAVVLHDALRCCQLKPRGSAQRNALDGDFDGAAETSGAEADAVAAEDAMTGGADVLARLLCAAFHLDVCEVYPADADPSRVYSPHDDDTAQCSSLPASAFFSDKALLSRCVCACRLPYEAASWNLVQHSDVFLEYVLRYLGELRTMECTALWVSPAQQQQAELALTECLQVVLAVLQAVDVWAAAYKAQVIHEQGEASLSTPPLSAIDMPTPMEERNVVDAFRVRLRSDVLPLLKQLLCAGDVRPVASASERTPNSMLQHSSIQNATKLLEGDVQVFEICSPAHPAMRRLCSSSPTGADGDEKQPFAPTRKSEVMLCATGAHSLEVQSHAHNLLHICTRAHFTALRAFMEEVAEPVGGAAANGGWSGSRLFYALRCLTEGSVHGSCASSRSSPISGGAQALLARLAAADVTHQRLSSLLVDTITVMEAAAAETSVQSSKAPQTRSLRSDDTQRGLMAQMMSHLRRAASEFSQAAVLLDEYTVWWNALHLESSVHHSVEGNGLAPGYGRSSAVSIQWASTDRSHLDHIRHEVARLTDALADLYTVAWWGHVMPSLERHFASCAAQFWTNDNVRFHNLYVSVFLRHRHGAAASPALQLSAMQAAERLQQALTRHSLWSLSEARGDGVECPLRISAVDMEDLLNESDTGRDTTSKKARRVAAEVERALLRTIVHWSLPFTQDEHPHGRESRVSVAVECAVFETTFAAALTSVSSRHASLLWRVLPLVVEAGGERRYGTAASAAAAAVQAGGALVYDVPPSLWQLLTALSPSTTVVAQPSDAGNHAPVGLGVEGALCVSLLSAAPIIVDGVLSSRLLRPPRRAVAGQGKSNTDAESEVRRWLEQLISYGMDETNDEPTSAFAAHEGSDTGERDAIIGACYLSLTAFEALPTISAAKATTTRAGPPVLLPLSSFLCRRLVPSLIAATLCDATLVPDVAPLPSSSSTSSLSREALLLHAVHALGYVAPQAWRVALGWIRHTPYPVQLPFDATHSDCKRRAIQSQAEAEEVAAPGVGLTPVEACALRRLRAAFQACGPWPAEVARPLLVYAVERQRRAQLHLRVPPNDPDISNGRDEAGASVFPEATELLALFQPNPVISHDHIAASEAASSVAADTMHHPLLSAVYTELMREETEAQVNNNEGRAKEQNREEQDKLPAKEQPAVTYDACACDSLAMQSLGATRQARFHVAASTLPLPTAMWTQRSLRWSRSITGAVADQTTWRWEGQEHCGATALSALQLASLVLTTAAADAGDSAMSFEPRPSLQLWMQQLSTMPTVSECAHLLHARLWKEEVMKLPRRDVAPVLQRIWVVLLMRLTELQASAGVGTTVTVTPPNAWSRPPVQMHDTSRSAGQLRFGTEEEAWLQSCASLFVVVSRASARFTTDLASSTAKAEMQHRAATQLSALRRELCCFWISALLECVLTRSASRCDQRAVDLGREVEAELEVLVAAYVGEDGDSSPRDNQTGSLQAHLRQALWMRDAQQQRTNARGKRTFSASGVDAEWRTILSEAQQELRRAVLLLLNKHHILGRGVKGEKREVEKLRGRDAAPSAMQVQWSMWPPAAWELSTVLNPLRCTSSDAAAVEVRNPLLVVALLQAWQRHRDDRRGKHHTRLFEVMTPLQLYTDSMTEIVVLTIDESSSFSHSRSDDVERPTTSELSPVAQKRSTALSNTRAAWTLMEVWRAVDSFVERGHVRLLPSVSTQRFSLSVSPSTFYAARVAASPVTLLAQSREANSAAVVIESFMAILSAEDARLHPHDRRSPQQRNATPHAAEDMLAFSAVLRCVRSRLLGVGESAEREACAAQPWRSYIPLNRASNEAEVPLPTPRNGGITSERKFYSPPPSPWQTFLHVLHLCTSGMLDRRAQRRGRRAAPSAAGSGCVTQKLEVLCGVHQEGVEGSRGGVGDVDDAHHSPSKKPSLLSPLLSREDGQRLLCWQLRQLQQIRTHVNALGWTVEQQLQLQEAQRHVERSVWCVACLTERGGDRSARENVAKENSSKTLQNVEAATATCFYPHLEMLKTTFASVPTRLGGTQRVEQVSHHCEAEADEVVTEFAHRTASASPSSSISLCQDAASATALLQGVHDVIFRESVKHEAWLTIASPQLRRDYKMLHTYLAAVLGSVARRQSSGSPRLLQELLSGAEVDKILRDMSCEPADIESALRHVLLHLLRLLALPTPSPHSPAATGVFQESVIEAGLQLCVTLRPWLPVLAAKTSTAGKCVTEAALAFALSATEGALWHSSSDDSAQSATKWTRGEVVRMLVFCVVHDTVRQRQSEVLSSNGVALLGALQQRLAQASKAASCPTAAVNAQRRSSLNSRERAAAPFENSEVLWRVLHALASLSALEAAEVCQAWRSFSSCTSASDKKSTMLHRGAQTMTAAPFQHDTAILFASGNTGMSATHGVQRGPSVIEGLYRDAVQLLHDSGRATQSSMNASGVAAAVRLRSWWAADAESAGAAQLHVLEDLLCRMVARNLPGVSEEKDSVTHRAARRACTETYSKYAALSRVCISPHATVAAINVNQQQQQQQQQGTQLHDVELLDDAFAFAPNLALRLSVAALLLPSPVQTAAGFASGLPDAHLLELLQCVVQQARHLAYRFPLCMKHMNGEKCAADDTLLPSVLVNPVRDISTIARHLLQSTNEHLRDTHNRDSSSSAILLFSPSSPLLRSWEAVLAPLQALRVAGTMCATHLDTNKVQLIGTARGLRFVAERGASLLTLCKDSCSRRCKSLTPDFYTTLRTLASTSHLLRCPLRVLLRELLVPLLAREEAHVDVTDGSTQTRLRNRVALLRQVAKQLSVHPAFYVTPSLDVGDDAGAAFHLAAMITAAEKQQVMMPDESRVPTEIDADLHGWPAALIVVKVLTRLDAALLQRCAPRRGEDGVGVLPSLVAATLASPSLSHGAARVFASHVAAALARRGGALTDYLAFALVTGLHSWTGPTAQNEKDERAEGKGIRSEDTVARAAHVTQLHHAVAVTAPPSSVGAIMALLRHPAASLSSSSPSTACVFTPAKDGDGLSGSRDHTCRLVVVLAVTEMEARELRQLCALLQPPK